MRLLLEHKSDIRAINKDGNGCLALEICSDYTSTIVFLANISIDIITRLEANKNPAYASLKVSPEQQQNFLTDKAPNSTKPFH